MVKLIADLVQDWRRLDERIPAVSAELARIAWTALAQGRSYEGRVKPGAA
jgi:hypothetical protein